MYAGITTSRVDPSRIDEAVEIYREKIIPLMADEKGALQLTLLADRETGKIISLGMWDSHLSALGYESSGGLNEAVSIFGDLFLSPPKREVFEVFIRADL